MTDQTFTSNSPSTTRPAVEIRGLDLFYRMNISIHSLAPVNDARENRADEANILRVNFNPNNSGDRLSLTGNSTPAIELSDAVPAYVVVYFEHDSRTSWSVPMSSYEANKRYGEIINDSIPSVTLNSSGDITAITGVTKFLSKFSLPKRDAN